jgi:hypothetical protein
MVRGDPLPPAHPVGLFAGKHDLAGVVVHAFEQDFDLIARLGRGLPVFPFVERDEPFRLVTDIDDYLVANDLNHSTWDNATGLDARAIAQELIHVKIFAVRFFSDVEFAEQVAIYHEKMWVRSVESDEPRFGLAKTKPTTGFGFAVVKGG